MLEPIETQENSTLPRIMQWILAVFAIYYNKMHKLTGHVWQGRYWSKIIDNIRQLFDTFNYISQNPDIAKLVKNAEEYMYRGKYYIINKIFDIVDKPEYDFF